MEKLKVKLSYNRVAELKEAKELACYYVKVQEERFPSDLVAFYGSCRYLLYFSKWEPFKVKSYVEDSLRFLRVSGSPMEIAAKNSLPFATKTGEAMAIALTEHYNSLLAEAQEGEGVLFEEQLKEDCQQRGEVSSLVELQQSRGFVSKERINAAAGITTGTAASGSLFAGTTPPAKAFSAPKNNSWQKQRQKQTKYKGVLSAEGGLSIEDFLNEKAGDYGK